MCCALGEVPVCACAGNSRPERGSMPPCLCAALWSSPPEMKCLEAAGQPSPARGRSSGHVCPVPAQAVGSEPGWPWCLNI